MSVTQIGFLGLFLLFAVSCKKEKPPYYADFDENEKEKLANDFHNLSDYFLQPSELYRTYKDSALLVQPKNVDLRQRLSYSYKKVGDHIKAMEVLNKAVNIDTANGKADVLEYRAWTLLYYYRDYEGTVKDVDLIEKITGKPYNPCWGEPCGFQKGQALYKLGEYKKAIETFETVNVEEEKLGFDINDNYMIFFYMGRCYAEMKAYEEAIASYKNSLASVEKFPEAYYQLGLVYKELDDEVKANQNFELAKKYVVYNMGEPYIERFDTVYLYMIEREMEK